MFSEFLFSNGVHFLHHLICEMVLPISHFTTAKESFVFFTRWQLLLLIHLQVAQLIKATLLDNLIHHPCTLFLYRKRTTQKPSKLSQNRTSLHLHVFKPQEHHLLWLFQALLPVPQHM